MNYIFVYVFIPLDINKDSASFLSDDDVFDINLFLSEVDNVCLKNPENIFLNENGSCLNDNLSIIDNYVYFINEKKNEMIKIAYIKRLKFDLDK